MLEYILDANVLMNMLISGKAFYKQLASHYRFITPTYGMLEIDLYKDEILQKTKMSEEQLQDFSFFLFSNLAVLPQFFLSEQANQRATILTLDIDIKDASYIALSLQMDVVFLTKDKKLEKGLKMKGFRKVMLWQDFLKQIA